MGRDGSRVASMTSPSVVCIIPDKLGGMLNILEGLFRFRHPDGFTYGAILTFNPLSTDARFGGRFNADFQAAFEFRTPVENLHAVLRRMHAAVPQGEGVLIVNDLLEMAYVSAFDTGRAVIQVIHGDSDYYYDLAARHEHVVDAFVVYGRTMERTLKARLPHRSGDIYFLPYGVPEPPARRTATDGPLRLLFAGRFEHGQKGVLDLPLIDRALVDRGVHVTWTMVGAGPDEGTLRDRWSSAGTDGRVRFLGATTSAEVLLIAAQHDVFVLPTRYEGVPVALIEAMSVGLVPVVSRIESGVAEILEHGRTGLMPPVGDVAGFAEAIASLDRDRTLVESISRAASHHVAHEHDLRRRTDAYQELFARYVQLRRPRPDVTTVPYGSRLDQPWMPNAAVRAVRSMIRRAKGKPY
jgi:glycosyltransferase involved in cell wall biosynthesis